MQPHQYGPFEFSGLPKRPKWNWPNGSKLAFWLCPNIEVFHLNVAMPNDSQERPTGREAIPMVRQWAQRDYGNRVGVWRVMEVLEKHGIRASAATNSDMCRHMPVIVEEMVKRKWEIMAHGRTNTHRVNEISAEEEQAYVKGVFDTFEEFTGKRPIGWLAPGLQETWNTLDYLLDNGCRYVSDWVNDDQPYRFDVGGRELINIPYSFEANDSAALWRQKQSMPEFERMIRETFDVLYAEGHDSARVMCISLHPFVIGQPNRIRSLDRLLAYIKGHKDVWYPTASEIMDAYLQAVPSRGTVR